MRIQLRLASIALIFITLILGSLSRAVAPALAKGPSFTVTVGSAFLRSAPDFSAPKVASVFKGQVLLVVSRSVDDQWLEVGASRISTGGWIHLSLGKFEGDLTRLPVGPLSRDVQLNVPTQLNIPTPSPTAPAGPATNDPAGYGTLSAYPVVPGVSGRAREIYQAGLAQGTDPHRFSKIGDCQAVPSHFLSMFDSPALYRLGKDYAYLQETINHFGGSFARSSEAVRAGFNIASVLSPLWADPKACQRGETPLQCEFRLHNPSLVIISMETWWSGDPAVYETSLRRVVEFSMSRGVLPIVATKADNLEGNGAINAAIVRVARDYDLPVWNFWLAAQPLPNHGLAKDAFHLTLGRPFFDDPYYMQRGWTIRNLTALQALDAVWRGVSVK